MAGTTSLLVLLSFANTIAAAPLQNAGPSVPRPLKWHQCPEKHERELGLECAHLEVPIDWNNPNGNSFWLEMNRLPARDKNARIGSAIYNPGGPGGSAIDDIICYAKDCDFVEPEILKHFDLIGLDPRGVGRSSPIRCDPELWNNYPSLYPLSEEEFDKLVAYNRAFSQSCLDRSGELLGAIDTINVAKDMEAVRASLGEGKLNYIGISYGTFIGGTYAELFPENIRAMVLDGVTDHSCNEIRCQWEEYNDYELELVRFAKWCESDPRCKLYGHDILHEWNQTVVKAMETPIPALGCKEGVHCRENVTWDQFIYNFQGYLITKFPAEGYWSEDLTWYNTAEYLHRAMNGDATEFSSHVCDSEHCEAWSEITVNCLDYPHGSRSVHDLTYQIQLATSNAPYTRGVGESYNPSSQCLGWVYPTQNPPHAYNPEMVKKAPPILMVNSYYDPETPYLQAVSVQEQLPSAVLLTRNGDGHSSFNLGGQASYAMAQYLVNLTLPELNTVVAT